MLQDAAMWHRSGARVVVVGANHNQVEHCLKHMCDPSLFTFQTVEKWKDYLLTGMYPVGFGPSDVVLFDHYAIEVAFPNIIREYDLYE
jgi:hypothetical protein